MGAAGGIYQMFWPITAPDKIILQFSNFTLSKTQIRLRKTVDEFREGGDVDKESGVELAATFIDRLNEVYFRYVSDLVLAFRGLGRNHIL